MWKILFFFKVSQNVEPSSFRWWHFYKSWCHSFNKSFTVTFDNIWHCIKQDFVLNAWQLERFTCHQIAKRQYKSLIAFNWIGPNHVFLWVKLNQNQKFWANINPRSVTSILNISQNPGFFIKGIHQLMQHYMCGYVCQFELLDEWTFELLNFRLLDETCSMKVCKWEYRVFSNIQNFLQNFIQHDC